MFVQGHKYVEWVQVPNWDWKLKQKIIKPNVYVCYGGPCVNKVYKRIYTFIHL